jgi:hypothetical protein
MASNGMGLAAGGSILDGLSLPDGKHLVLQGEFAEQGDVLP